MYRLLLRTGLVVTALAVILPVARAQWWQGQMTSYPPMTYDYPYYYGNYGMPTSNYWALHFYNCGDNRRQYYEQCDDGNTRDGDGCNRFCRREPRRQRVYGCMNGKYRPGETYVAADGCNICTCQLNGASSCTKMACPSVRDRCTSTSQCASDEICSTELGDCQSACPPGAEICTLQCTGVCQKRPVQNPRNCQPYTCADGSVFRSCNANGTPINYFADPCMGHGGQVTSLCGNGICEQGEASSCPSCTYTWPYCKVACRPGTCEQDCR